jgi:hypothetical protein
VCAKGGTLTWGSWRHWFWSHRAWSSKLMYLSKVNPAYLLSQSKYDGSSLGAMQSSEDWGLIIGVYLVGYVLCSTNTFTGSIAVVIQLFCINNQCSVESSL